MHKLYKLGMTNVTKYLKTSLNRLIGIKIISY